MGGGQFLDLRPLANSLAQFEAGLKEVHIEPNRLESCAKAWPATIPLKRA